MGMYSTKLNSPRAITWRLLESERQELRICRVDMRLLWRRPKSARQQFDLSSALECASVDLRQLCSYSHTQSTRTGQYRTPASLITIGPHPSPMTASHIPALSPAALSFSPDPLRYPSMVQPLPTGLGILAQDANRGLNDITRRECVQRRTTSSLGMRDSLAASSPTSSLLQEWRILDHTILIYVKKVQILWRCVFLVI
jgi:hypothetical protein